MNKTYRHIFSYFLLLYFFATLIPINLFHHHEQYPHCDRTDANIESDPCHISIYHGQSKEHICGHKSHLTNVHDACKSCKFLTPRQYHYTSIGHYQHTIVPILVSRDFSLEYKSFIPLYFSNAILGRAPPAC